MHKSLKSIKTVIFERIKLLKAHVVSFFSYLTSVPRTFDLDCRCESAVIREHEGLIVDQLVP